MDISVQSEPSGEMPQHAGDGLNIYAVLKGAGGEGVTTLVETELYTAIVNKAAYEKQYGRYCKLLKVCREDIQLSEIVEYIKQIVVDSDRQILVKSKKVKKGEKSNAEN